MLVQRNVDVSPDDLYKFWGGRDSFFDYGSVFSDIIGFPVGVGDIYHGIFSNTPRASLPSVVISEVPQTVLPQGSGAVVATGTPGALSIPKGFHRCIIAGQERICVDQGPVATDVVLPPIEPWVLRTPVPLPVDDSEFEEEEPMAHDWGHLGRQVLGGWLGGGDSGGPVYETPFTQGFAPSPAIISSGGAAQPGAAGCEPCGPRYLTYDCKTGKFSSRKRRRRRRLATPSDLADLAAIVAITGKGSAMNQAVAGLVRR